MKIFENVVKKMAPITLLMGSSLLLHGCGAKQGPAMSPEASRAEQARQAEQAKVEQQKTTEWEKALNAQAAVLRKEFGCVGVGKNIAGIEEMARMFAENDARGDFLNKCAQPTESSVEADGKGGTTEKRRWDNVRMDHCYQTEPAMLLPSGRFLYGVIICPVK